MPVDADALDRFAREVTENLAQGGGGAVPGLEERCRVFTAAMVAVTSVHTLADRARPPEVRMRALHTSLEGLFIALGREGRLGEVLARLTAADTGGGEDKSPEAHLARLISTLCRLATDADEEQDEAMVASAAGQMLVSCDAATELRWFISSGRLTDDRLRSLARALERAGAELTQRVRELEPDQGAFPFVPISLAGTAVADGVGLQGGDLKSGSGLAAQEEGVVDAMVRAAARTSPVVGAYQRMRAARKELDHDGWAGAARRFEDVTDSLVPLVVELLVPAGRPSGWERGAVEKRIANVIARQQRLSATLPRLRDDYRTAIEAYLTAERSWKAVFKSAVLALAGPGVLDHRSLRYLREEYPQLAITAADLGVAPEATAAAAPPPAVVAPPAAPAASAPPRVAEPLAPPPAPPPIEVVAPAAREGVLVEPPASRAATAPPRAVALVAVAALAVGAVAGYGLAHLGTSDAMPRNTADLAVTTTAVAAPPAGTRIAIHLDPVPTRDGSRLGGFDEADTTGVPECSPGLIRVPEITAGGQRYEVRVAARGTTVIFGDRATLDGPAPLAYQDGKSADGSVVLKSGSSGVLGSVTVRAACPGSVPPPLTMARAIPAAVDISSVGIPAAVGWDPGVAGYPAGVAVIAAGVVLMIRYRPRVRSEQAMAPALLLVGALMLGYTGQKQALDHGSAATAPPGLQVRGCGSCPNGIRIASAEVQARADSDLLIFRGSWSGASKAGAPDLHLLANNLDILLRARADPPGFQLASATRGGVTLDPGSVAVGVRPDALLLDVKQSALSEPVTFGLEVMTGARSLATVPASGELLLWDGTTDPVITHDTLTSPVPSAAAASAPPPATPSAPPASPSPSAGPPSPSATPVPPADLMELFRGCASVAGGRLPDEITPVNLVFAAAPDLTTSASTHYLSTYFARPAFSRGLAGHSPFAVTVAIRRAPIAGHGPPAIDAVGDIQLVAYWDGHSLSRGVRTFTAGQWTMHRDDPAAKALSIEVRPGALVFYWNGFQSGDKIGVIAADASRCTNIGIKAPSTPVAPLPL